MNRELSRAVRELVGSVDTACQAGRPGQMCLKDRENRGVAGGDSARRAGRETSRDIDRPRQPRVGALGFTASDRVSAEGLRRRAVGGGRSDPVRAF